jgi:ABC-type amino acid transport substrate-binding protein
MAVVQPEPLLRALITTTTNHRGRDGGTNFILMIKEQETHLTLHEHDDDDDDDELLNTFRWNKDRLKPSGKGLAIHYST